jgi:uncharacterized protein YjbJ (UPF0337 family)
MGAVKEGAGRLSGDKKLQSEGKIDKAKVRFTMWQAM